MYRKGTNEPRKPYIKPCVAIENFALNQFIATSCTVSAKAPNWRDLLKAADYFAYVAVERTGQFTPELQCAHHADDVLNDMGVMDTLCYHTATSPLFGS